MIEIILRFLGSLLFFLPGILMSFIIFPSTTILKRFLFSIALSVSLLTFLGMFLAFIKELKFYPVIFSLIFLCFFLFLILRVKIKKEKLKTIFKKKPFFLVFFFSLLGTLWRIFLKIKFNLSGDTYLYAAYLIEKSIKETGSFLIQVPHLNFYSGMVGGHAHYLGGTIVRIIWKLIGLNFDFINIFLGVFLYLGFCYLTVLFLTKKRNLAVLATFLMAFGPVEIWKTTQSFFGHPLSYIALFSLFIFFFSPTLGYFFLALFVSFALILSYYTGAMVVMIISFGFLIANMIFEFLKRRKIAKEIFLNRKNFLFLLIIFLSFLFVFLITNANKYTQAHIKYIAFKTKTNLLSFSAQELEQKPKEEHSFQEISSPMSLPLKNYHYTGPFKIFGFPLLALEDFIFLSLPLFFLFYFFFSRERKKEDVLMLLCFIPVCLLSSGFLIVNSPERILYYFTFFTIASIRTKKENLLKLGIFLFLITIIFCFLRFYQRPYLTKFESEIQAAKWIKENIQGIVFTDQHFANILILNDFYNVQGIVDKDEKNFILYRQEDPQKIRKVLKSLGVDYIAITKRMREIYILSLNFPQIPMSNEEVYDKNFKKVYDNGDIKIYKIETDNF